MHFQMVAQIYKLETQKAGEKSMKVKDITNYWPSCFLVTHSDTGRKMEHHWIIINSTYSKINILKLVASLACYFSVKFYKPLTNVLAQTSRTEILNWLVTTWCLMTLSNILKLKKMVSNERFVMLMKFTKFTLFILKIIVCESLIWGHYM